MHIQSSSNKTYKFIKSLLMKKSREENRCYIAEGIKTCMEALKSRKKVKLIAFDKNAEERLGEILKMGEKIGCEIYSFDERMFCSMSDTKNPEGVLCVIEYGEDIEEKDGLYLYCDKVSDPGNAGTLIRCADAVGACGVVFSPGSVDIYNPKTIRAAMGSVFHIPVFIDESSDFLLKKQNDGYSVYATALSDSAVDYKTASYPEKCIIVVGNEANGVSEKILKKADQTLIIPIYGDAESLNVSVAGAIVMYEWRRNN